jgi:hypothetical protein
MSFFAQKIEQEVDLILDVGNGSVAGALVLFNKTLAPKIIFSKRLQFSISDNLKKEDLYLLVLRNLEDVVSYIFKDGVEQMNKMGIKEKIRHTFCVLSSPWYVSKTKILNIEDKDPIFINKNFIDNLLQKEQSIFEEEVDQKKYGNISKNDIEFIEKKIIQTKLNGYTTTDPYKKHARQIELSIYMSVASKKIAHSIERVVGKFFNSKHMGIFSFSFIEHNVIGDIFSKDSDFVFMDISSKTTDISSVEKHILMETVTFPVGKNDLIKKVAEHLQVLPEIALSFIKMDARGHAEAESSEKIRLACEKAKEEWNNYFFKCFLDISKGCTPSKIFVTVDPDVAPLFLSFTKENLALAQKNSLDFQSIPVIVLDDEKLSQFVEFDMRNERDSFIAIESVFFNKLFSESVE